MFQQGCKSKVLMEAFDTGQSLIDINETAKKHAGIAPSQIDAHALSGCDSVPKLYGIGKKTVITHLKDHNLSLSNLGNTACLHQKHKIDFIMLWYQKCEKLMWSTILSLGKTNWKEVNINPKVGVSTSYYRGLPTQCPTCPLSSLHLERLAAAKTSKWICVR